MESNLSSGEIDLFNERMRSAVALEVQTQNYHPVKILLDFAFAMQWQGCIGWMEKCFSCCQRSTHYYTTSLSHQQLASNNDFI